MLIRSRSAPGGQGSVAEVHPLVGVPTLDPAQPWNNLHHDESQVVSMTLIGGPGECGLLSCRHLGISNICTIPASPPCLFTEEGQ